MTNRYPGTCCYCGARVAKNAGRCWKPKGSRRYVVAHLNCKESGKSEVVEFYSPVTGWSGTQNRNGRCEDAPCCGCCTC